MPIQKTTKAAKCPKCKNYHFICSIERFESDKDIQKEFSYYMKDGFEIISVTTEDAKKNFGYC